MKTFLLIGLRVLGVALVVYILSQVEYLDHYSTPDGREHAGRAGSADGRVFFRVDGTGEELPLPDDWRTQDIVRPGLSTIVDDSDKVLLLLMVFMFGPITLISITRWWYLLNHVDVPISYGEAFRLTFVGAFFNTVMPGQTGGDLVKGVYIARHAGRGKRVKAFMSVFVDRAIGIVALGLLAGIALAPKIGDPKFRVPAIIVFSFLGVVAFFGGLYLSRRLRAIVRLDALARKLPFSKTLLELKSAVGIYRQYPKAVVIALLLSLANHMMLLLMSIGMGRAIGIDRPAIEYFMLVPVGLMIASIPLLPGGWGTREWGFRGIFAQVGVPATQSVALSVIIGLTQLGWSLLGGILFLLSPDRLSRTDVVSFAEKMDEEAVKEPATST